MGAVGDNYATLDELKGFIEPQMVGDVDPIRDLALTSALNSASREIENYCGQQFNRDEVATSRVFEPLAGSNTIYTDPFWTDEDLIVQAGTLGGSWGQPWSNSYLECFPRNGLVSGMPHPYNEIKMFGFQSYTNVGFCSTDRVRVTAKWGWVSVPAPVKEVCLHLAQKNYKLADYPMGDTGLKGFHTSKVQDDPILCQKLYFYKSVRGYI